MTWFKVDDTLAFHRKVVAAGNAAMGLWVRAGSFCAQQLTDGFVPEHMAVVLGTPAQAQRLISAGLWREVEGGYMFHEWNENGRQPTSQGVRERRQTDADRQAKWRAENPRTPQVTEPGHTVTNAGVTAGVTVGVTTAPTRPDPKTKTPLSSVEKVTLDRARVEDPACDCTPAIARRSKPAARPGHDQGRAPSGPNAPTAHRAVAAFGQSITHRSRQELAYYACLLLDDGIDGQLLTETIARWMDTPGKSPSLLRFLADDIAREKAGGGGRHLRSVVNGAVVSNAPCGDFWQD